MTNSLLARPTYGLTEAARLLKIPSSTLRFWLEGMERQGRKYPPVLRWEAKGTSELTWGEFVEAGYLREYRHDLPLVKLRPLHQALSQELGTPHPLATEKPMVGGRTLVWNLQRKLDLPEELWIVVGGKQLVLGDAASAFFGRVEFDPVTEEARSYVVKQPATETERPVVVDPEVAFAVPTICGVRTETLAELVRAGERHQVVADIYRDYGITSQDVNTAEMFESELLAA